MNTENFSIKNGDVILIEKNLEDSLENINFLEVFINYLSQAILENCSISFIIRRGSIENWRGYVVPAVQLIRKLFPKENSVFIIDTAGEKLSENHNYFISEFCKKNNVVRLYDDDIDLSSISYMYKNNEIFKINKNKVFSKIGEIIDKDLWVV